MLREFLLVHRSELTERCRSKVATRLAANNGAARLEDGIPIFLDRLIDLMPLEFVQSREDPAPSKAPNNEAMLGRDLLRRGYSLDQMVLGYGDLCLSVVELAMSRDAPISVQEFGTLMTRLDNAIAASVTEHALQREIRMDGGEGTASQRLKRLAHEMRNLLGTVSLAISAIKTGTVGFGGSTGAALDRSLGAMKGLVDSAVLDADQEMASRPDRKG